MLDFTLDDGTKVCTGHFTFSETYSGLLEGDPSKSEWINKGILNRLRSPSDWGPRKTFIVQPEMDKGLLPPFIYTAWLDCSTPIDPKMHGSELVLIWFGAPPEERSIPSIIHEGIRKISWKQHAQDFEY